MSQVNISAAIKSAKKIVYKAAQEDTLQYVALDTFLAHVLTFGSCICSELTPKQVRNKVEEQLGLKKGTLEEGEYKKKLKATIEAAVVSQPHLVMDEPQRD